MSAPAKRFKPEVNDETKKLRNQIILDIIKINIALREKYKKYVTASIFDLNDCMTLGRAIFSAINYIRKDKTPPSDIKVTIFESLGSSAMTDMITVIKPLLHEDSKSSTVAKRQSYWGMMMPILTMLTSLKLRIDEIRNGTTVIFGTKTGEGTNRKNAKEKITKWGLNPNHSILLDGITYPPESCSSVCQSLGAMTNILNMIHQDSNYDGKFYDAALYQIGFLPNANEVLDFIRRKTGIPSKILTLLGNLLIMTGTRQAYRYSFPIEVLYVIDPEKLVTLKILEKKIDDNYGVQAATLWEKTPGEVNFDIDFSGRKGARTYMKFASLKWTLKLGKNMSETDIKQILFHAMTNTQHTEFDVLSAITNFGGWKCRYDFGGNFKGKKTSAAIEITPIAFTFISKLLSACPTKMITQQNGALFSASAFSGRIHKKFDETHFKSLEDNDYGGMETYASLENVLNMLQKLIARCKEQIKKDNFLLEYGTTNWYKIDTFIGTGELDQGINLALSVTTQRNFFSPRLD